jgi:steroid delta-isomerase-like uncharacterized protein
MMLLLSKSDRRGLPMAGEQQDLIKRAEDWLEAFNAGDWQRFAAGMTPDVVYEETGTQRRVDGVDAYVQLCQGWKQAFPDVRGTIRNVVASGDTVAQEVTWEGTHTGPLEGPGGPLPPSGRRITIPATLWITFSGDQGKEVHHHLDVLTLLGQLGALPAP